MAAFQLKHITPRAVMSSMWAVVIGQMCGVLATLLPHDVTRRAPRSSWLCWRWFLSFPQEDIHHLRGIYKGDVFFVLFSLPLKQSQVIGGAQIIHCRGDEPRETMGKTPGCFQTDPVLDSHKRSKAVEKEYKSTITSDGMKKNKTSNMV